MVSTGHELLLFLILLAETLTRRYRFGSTLRGASNVILMYLSMILQHTSIVVFTIAPFLPVIVSAETNMSGNNSNNSLNLRVDNTNCPPEPVRNLRMRQYRSQKRTSCRTCQSQATLQQIFNAQNHRDDQDAYNARDDDAIDRRSSSHHISTASPHFGTRQRHRSTRRHRTQREL